MVDLPPEHLQEVKSILKDTIPQCEVRAFGSRVAGGAWKYSDLDLAIVGSGRIDWRTLEGLKDCFANSNLPIMVDILDWHSIAKSFRQTILSCCEVIQEGEPE